MWTRELTGTGLVLLAFCLAPGARGQAEQATSPGNVSSEAAAPVPGPSAPGPSGSGPSAPGPAGQGRTPSALRPVDGTWQTGMGIGLFFPSSELGLIGSGYQPAQFSTAAFEFFGRIGYYPKAFLGVEVEVATMLGGVANEGAAMYAFRTQFILQYPTATVVPFATVGVGGLGAASGLTGHDIDVAYHLGGGLKFPLTPELAMRFDVRENLSSGYVGGTAALAASEEASFGIELTIGRPPQAAEKPAYPPDRDRDHVADELDSCPDEPALTADGCPMDTDGDGLADVIDVCPRQPGLFKLRGCPEPDPDQDGVEVPCDRCPAVKGVMPDGCPPPDSDEDGLLDDVDHCRDQAETPNGFRDADGCPDDIPAEVQRVLGVQPEITFAPGGATFLPRSAATLERLRAALHDFPEISLEIIAHATSAQAKPSERALQNQALSERQAQAIADWLEQRGIAKERLSARGVGEDQPLAPGRSRAENEGVEVVLRLR